jgi:hypothetical protein
MGRNESEIIDKTIALVQSRTGRRTGKNISRTEARRVVDNVGLVFRLLQKWDQEAADDTSDRGTAHEAAPHRAFRAQVPKNGNDLEQTP